MGEREVVVGCPHRLRQFIGSRTAHPCPACAPFGPPGWPRLAIALTVDYGPRLSVKATEGVVVTPEPPAPVRPVVTAQTLAQAALALRKVVAHPTLVDAVQAVTIERSAPQMFVQQQTAEERAANVVRMAIAEELRLRHRR